jgi:hypothetical protein
MIDENTILMADVVSGEVRHTFRGGQSGILNEGLALMQLLSLPLLD